MIDRLETSTYMPVNTYRTSGNPGNKPSPDVQPLSGGDASGAPIQTAVSGAGSPQNKTKRNENGDFDRYECHTCENRKYQDGSNDPGVSFKSPTTLSPEKAASAVRSHENEHVSRERASAKREGREVVSQSVSYHSAVCPECGRVYVSGGTTETVTKKQLDQTYGLAVEEKGKYLDLTA